MPLFNRATNEVTLKLVYYGPGRAGKSANLRFLHAHAEARSKGRLVSFAAQQDETLFFELVPLEPAAVLGLRPRLQLYAVPGRVANQAMPRSVLRGCDAVVFVADSEAAMLEVNLESLRTLEQDLRVNELDPALPRVFQYNKRDSPKALPLTLLEARLNPRGLPSFEAVATEGIGVEPTFRGVTALAFEWLERPSPRTNAPVRREPAERAPLPSGLRPAEAVGAGPAQGGAEEALPDTEGLSAEDWFYLHGGRRNGPVALDELVDLVLTSVPEDTPVWHAGLEGWTRAASVGAIADEIPPPVPVAAAAPYDGEMPEFAAVPRIFRRVLIADEDASYRKYLARPLAAQGFTIHEAGDGAAAWQGAVRHRPWMILADVNMPELDGFEFCRRVRSHPLLDRRPVLFISGSDNYRERHRALSIGADEFLSKNMPIRELLIRMQLLMTRYSDLGTPQRPEDERDPATLGALEGRLEQLGAPALLQICGEGRLTGTLALSTGEAQGIAAVLGFREGEIVSARVGERSGEAAVYQLLEWRSGSFRLAPGDPGPRPAPLPSTEELLVEGCRRIEESRRA